MVLTHPGLLKQFIFRNAFLFWRDTAGQASKGAGLQRGRRLTYKRGSALSWWTLWTKEILRWCGVLKCTKWKWLAVCDKHTKCPPELDSGTFSKIWYRNMGKAPAQGRCDGKKGQCVKAISVVMERSNKKTLPQKNEEGCVCGVFQDRYCFTKRVAAFDVPDTAIMV